MFGERLQEIRKDHGDTQERLAEKLQVSKFTVASWEQGKSTPSHELLRQICRLYRVSADYLLDLSDSEQSFIANSLAEPFCAEERQLLRDYSHYLIWRRKYGGSKS